MNPATLTPTAAPLPALVLQCGRQLLVYRDPVALPAGLGATAYRTHLDFDKKQTVSLRADTQASVRVAELLP